MASRYHWATAGADLGILGFFPTAQSAPITIPAGATLKRFMVRNASFQVATDGTANSYIFPWAVAWTVAFTSGANSGRTIYSTVRDIPFEETIFVPITGSSRMAYWHAGDLQLGFNERCSYGKQSEPAANLQFSYSFRHDAPTTVTNTNGRFTWQCAALYYL